MRTSPERLAEPEDAQPKKEPRKTVRPDFNQREIVRIPEITRAEQCHHKMAEGNRREPNPGHAQGTSVADVVRVARDERQGQEGSDQ